MVGERQMAGDTDRQRPVDIAYVENLLGEGNGNGVRQGKGGGEGGGRDLPPWRNSRKRAEVGRACLLKRHLYLCTEPG